MSIPDITVEKRENWGTRLGYLMATWFAAIGIGNMWRFPFRCAENGGAFLLPYLVFILFISLPAVMGEGAIGKYGRSSTVGTMGKASGLRGIGVLMLFLNMFAAYYIVVVSQSMYWVGQSALNTFATKAPETVWNEFMSNGWLTFAMFAVTVVLAAVPPYFGIQKGIEKASKWMGGFACVFIVVGAVKSVSSAGALDGVVYYLTPNWDNMFTSRNLTSALSQAYFTFGAGWGWFMILSSYLKREADVGFGFVNTGLADTAFALLAGFAIIPTLFASGYTVDTVKTLGASTAYVAMPKVFMEMPGGYIISLLFFIALFIAAYSCAYVLLEVIASFMVDTMKLPRKKGTIISAVILLVCGAAPSVSESLLNNMDSFFGCFVLPSLVTLQVLAIGYRFGGERLRRSVINVFGNGYIGAWMMQLYKYLIPVVNIFLMIWFAHANSMGDSAHWFLGYGGLLLVVVFCLVVVAGFHLYDRRSGASWVGNGKEGV